VVRVDAVAEATDVVPLCDDGVERVRGRGEVRGKRPLKALVHVAELAAATVLHKLMVTMVPGVLVVTARTEREREVDRRREVGKGEFRAVATSLTHRVGRRRSGGRRHSEDESIHEEKERWEGGGGRKEGGGGGGGGGDAGDRACASTARGGEGETDRAARGAEERARRGGGEAGRERG
jgi:hypothetical protein